MSWKHEQPIDEMLAQEMGPDTPPQERLLEEGKSGLGPRESTPDPTDPSEKAFGSVSPPRFSRSPKSFRSCKIYSLSSTFCPQSPQVRGRQCARSPVSQRPQQDETAPFPDDGRDQQTPGAALGPAHPITISEALSGRKRGLFGLFGPEGNVSKLPSPNTPQPDPADLKSSFGALAMLPVGHSTFQTRPSVGAEVPELPSPSSVTSAASAPRRTSKRLQEKKEKVAPNANAVDALADSLPRPAASTPRGRLKLSGSAKPSGASKRQRRNTGRRGQSNTRASHL